LIKANTGYNKLKSVIVGRELNLEKRLADITFKYFYKENLGEKIYENPISEYKVNYDFLQERIQDLDNLAKVLENEGIEVHRPEEINKVLKIQTPEFVTELSSPSNVRDLTFVYQNKLIETPTFVRNRYFENHNMLDIFYNVWNKGKGGIWIKSPFQKLTEESIDLDPWNAGRDFDNIPDNFEMAIDGAQYMRINEKECFVNISTYNHYLGHLWIEQQFSDVKFHKFYQLIDNHIDGAFNILREGVFLVNPKYRDLKDKMPEKFKDWKYLYPNETKRKYPKEKATDIQLQLASERGMDINILSIDSNTVVVSQDALGTIEVLEKNGFKVISVPFRHSEIFAGGIHCSTLDIYREE
jgi:glycine amidinotransferase